MNCTVGTEDFPIPGFPRCQFPIRICFAIMINKSQGQSISGLLGTYRSAEWFSQAQLYVALSKATNPRIVLACTESKNKIVKNIIYSEVFQSKFNPNSCMMQFNRVYQTESFSTSHKTRARLSKAKTPKLMSKSQRSNSSVHEFQETYGLIPAQISFGGINLSSFAHKSVICLESWVDN